LRRFLTIFFAQFGKTTRDKDSLLRDAFTIKVNSRSGSHRKSDGTLRYRFASSLEIFNKEIFFTTARNNRPGGSRRRSIGSINFILPRKAQQKLVGHRAADPRNQGSTARAAVDSQLMAESITP
jgi:hypothetical protein